MGFWNGIKRIVFWDFPRGSWQYDVIVIAILAFIFLTPQAWFHDRPRIFSAGDIVMLPAEHGSSVYWVEPELLAGVEPAEQIPRAGVLLRERTGKNQEIVRLEPIYGNERELRGYMAFVRP